MHIQYLNNYIESTTLSQQRPFDVDYLIQTTKSSQQNNQTTNNSGMSTGPCHHCSATNLDRSKPQPSTNNMGMIMMDSNQLNPSVHHSHQQTRPWRQLPTNLGSCPSLPTRVVNMALSQPHRTQSHPHYHPLFYRPVLIKNPNWVGQKQSPRFCAPSTPWFATPIHLAPYQHCPPPPHHHPYYGQIARFGPKLPSSPRLVQPDQCKVCHQEGLCFEINRF